MTFTDDMLIFKLRNYSGSELRRPNANYGYVIRDDTSPARRWGPGRMRYWSRRRRWTSRRLP